MKNIFALSLLLALASTIVANTPELDKFNNTKSTISFTENKGQVNDQNYNPRPDVLFSGVANGLQFHIRNNGVSYQTSRVDSWKQKEGNPPEGMSKEGITDSLPDQTTIYRTDMNWLGFNKDFTIETGASTAGFNNYYLPSCPDGAMNVRSYVDVTFKNLYAGIDVKWYEKNGELEYDFILAPNADYTKISWEIKGADRISIGENGQLIIETPLGNIEEQAPIAFQGEEQVKATWKIEGNKISFQLGSYNENKLLIIDPVVRQWGTYYGGTGEEEGYSCATDSSGNIYLSGFTESTSGIATIGAHKTIFGGGTDAFLVKFNSSGVRQWGTYYGGTGQDGSYYCATDSSGNIYLLGGTGSTSGIATTGAHQTTIGGGSLDAFLVKFNSSGVRQWGTYYGGTGNDYGYSCATDTSGNIYLSGKTPSTSGIATAGAHQTTYGGGSYDAFLVKFNSSGVRQWGTYCGGTGEDYGNSCATDASGNIYLSGSTNSTSGIATTGAHQTTIGGGSLDAFLVKFNSSGVRQWGTYYGGTGQDGSYYCATDASGNIYLSGKTSSTSGIATTGAHQTTFGGSYDAFLVKFNSSGVRQSGTYYGGTDYDASGSCATDASGNIYLSGYTASTTGIVTTGAHQTTLRTSTDAFLVKFNPSGVRQWGTYYGGTRVDVGPSCATDGSGNIYLSGRTFSSSGIATTGAHQTTNRGNWDAFLVKFLDCETSYSQDTITACDSYTWINNITYTSSNTSAKDTLVNVWGCDSIVTLNLTVLSTFTLSSSFSDTTLAFNGDTIELDGGSRYTSFLWSNGDTTRRIKVHGAGKISVIARDSSGACGKDSTTLIYVNKIKQRDSTICSGTSVSLYILNTINTANNSLMVSKTYPALPWGPVTLLTNATSSDGESNTIQIVDSLGSYNLGNYAANYCLTLVEDGYNDWYLPTGYEVANNLCQNKTLINNWTAPGYYWSSSERTIRDATKLYSNTNPTTSCGSVAAPYKTDNCIVRCVRRMPEVKYLWSTGSTSSLITGTPDNTTTYSVIQRLGSYTITDSVTVPVYQISSTDTITSCGAFTWTNGVTYANSNNTATDTFINAAGCDSIVKLNLTVDIIKPTVITQNLTVSLDATGSGSITATQLDNGSTDNCTIATRTLSKYSFDCSNLGTNTIWLRVTDVNGNVDSASAVITVQDIIKPTVVSTPSDLALGYCDAAYTYPLPTATDNCGVTVTQVAGLVSGSVFPVGITTNTFEIKDPSGNTVTTGFTVDIRDRYMPFDTTNMSLCQNDAQIDLSRGYTNLTFTGQGIEPDEITFNPMEASSENYLITRIFIDSMGCISKDSIKIEVRLIPNVPIIDRVASDKIVTSLEYNTYQWYRNGTALEGKTEHLLRVYELGIYSVLVGNTEKCFANSEGYGFGIPVNQEQVTNQGTVKVYPNPTEGLIFIEMSDGDLIHNLSISNGLGVEILTQVANTSVARMDMSSLPPGTYFLQITSTSTNASIKLVKM